MPGNEWLSVEEVAKAERMSKRQVRAWCRKGWIHCQRLGFRKWAIRFPIVFLRQQ